MKSIYAAVALGFGTLALGACSQETTEAEEVVAPLSVTEGRLFLPAVEGNPAAVYFTITNDSDRAVAVRKAEVDGAERTEMHDFMEVDNSVMSMVDSVTLDPGETLSFEPGAKHLMAFDISPDLKPESVTSVTLTMLGGDTMSFDVDVLPANAER